MTKCLAILLAALLSLLPLVSCSTVSGARQLDEMSQPSFERYRDRQAQTVAAIVAVAIDEGDLLPEDVDLVASAVIAVADGEFVSLALALEDKIAGGGYESLALIIALFEVETWLESRGAYDEEGFLASRGAEVLRAVAQAAKDAAAAAAERAADQGG